MKTSAPRTSRYSTSRPASAAQVERQTLLITAVEHEAGIDRRPSRDRHGAPAIRVAGAGRLDLDDLGAEIRHHRRRRRPGDKARAIDDLEPVENAFGHAASSSSFIASRANRDLGQPSVAGREIASSRALLAMTAEARCWRHGERTSHLGADLRRVGGRLAKPRRSGRRLGRAAPAARDRRGDGRGDAAHRVFADPQFEPRFLDRDLRPRRPADRAGRARADPCRRAAVRGEGDDRVLPRRHKPGRRLPAQRPVSRRQPSARPDRLRADFRG